VDKVTEDVNNKFLPYNVITSPKEEEEDSRLEVSHLNYGIWLEAIKIRDFEVMQLAVS